MNLYITHREHINAMESLLCLALSCGCHPQCSCQKSCKVGTESNSILSLPGLYAKLTSLHFFYVLYLSLPSYFKDRSELLKVNTNCFSNLLMLKSPINLLTLLTDFYRKSRTPIELIKNVIVLFKFLSLFEGYEK